ncbi:MAG: hypothetical protein KAI17_25380, partial [Thiotrichaceae bacterium]|nr:hypothetical protein [Thiotrichaceae bacterium]
NILATLSQTDPKTLLDSLLKKFEKNLAAELFKKQLAKDVNINEREENELSRYFMECILSEKNGRYSIKAQLNNPIIGIGAPVSYFLPNAGKKLNTNVVIPENADVANALGAITSHVMIKRKISIRPDPLGCFIVEGLKGGKQFQNIDEAEAWAIEHLKTNILKMGKLAGTSKKTIEMKINDSIADTKDGTSLFLNRTIQAELSGSPDLVIKSA